MAQKLSWKLARWTPVATMGPLLGWLVLVPIILVLVSSFRPTGFPLDDGWTIQNYTQTYTDRAFWILTSNTAIFAIGATIMALMLGITIAWLVERTDLPMKGAVRAMVILPMATPPVLMAIGWVMLLSPRTGFFNHLLMGVFGLEDAPINIYSLGGMIFVEGLALVPSTFLILSPAFRNMDPGLEEAAFTSGASIWTAIRRVFLPLMAPTILAATVFLLIVGFLVFDIPGTIGMPVGIFVLSSQVVFLANDSPSGLPEYGLISAMAVFFLILVITLAWSYQRMTRLQGRYVTVTGKGWRANTVSLGKWRWVAFGCVAVYFFLAVVAPLAMLIWTSLTPYQAPVSMAMLSKLTLNNHLDFFSNSRAMSAAMNSVLIAVVAATGVAILSVLVSWIVVRTRAPGRKLIDILSFLPIAVPGTLIGVGLVYVYLALNFLPIYGSIWIIAIAYTTNYLSFGSRATHGVMLQIHSDLEEAAKVSGAGWWRTMRRIVAPLAFPAIMAVWIWVLAHCMRELTAALLLHSSTNTTVPVLLWGYWTGGEPNKAAAVGVWLVVAMLVTVVAWQVLSTRSKSTADGVKV